jgi:hypothetical protein
MKAKQFLVDMLGGSCWVCGYSRYIGGLDFHHLDPSTKDPDVNTSRTIALKRLIVEVKKCALLCCRCHREVEAGIVDLVEYIPLIAEPAS